MSRMLMISSDCHAGALPSMYNEFMPAKYRAAADDWWLTFTREMIARTGTFFDQEAVDDFSETTGQATQFQTFMNTSEDIEDSKLTTSATGTSSR